MKRKNSYFSNGIDAVGDGVCANSGEVKGRGQVVGECGGPADRAEPGQYEVGAGASGSTSGRAIGSAGRRSIEGGAVYGSG